MSRCSTPNSLSEPHIPDLSFGSSVSSDMKNEYEELIKYTVVVPQFNPKIGPQVLENTKGLFITTALQTQIQQQNQLTMKLKEKTEKQVDREENAAAEVKENATKKEDLKLDENADIKLNENVQETVNKKLHEETMEGMSSSFSNTSLESFSPHCTNYLKRDQANMMNNYNSIHNCNNNNRNNCDYLTDNLEERPLEFFRSLNNNNNHNNINNNHLLLVNTNYDTTCQTNNNITEYSSETSQEINPRKHSPVPISPPTNIDIDATIGNSLELILNNPPAPSQMHAKSSEKHKTHSSDKKTSNGGSTHVKQSLDRWFKEFQGHVLSEFEKSRLQLMQEQQRILIEEKEKQAQDITKLQKEIETMKSSLNELEQSSKQKDEVIANLSKALEKQREKTDLVKVMMDWKQKKMEASREKFTTKLADKFYENRIKTKMLLNWNMMMAKKNRKDIETAGRKTEKVCFLLAEKYEERIKNLEEQLKRSQEETIFCKNEMNKYEENMRKALMRGVCALNLEAMSIFNDDNINMKKNLNLHNVSTEGGRTVAYYSDEDVNVLESNQNCNNSNGKRVNLAQNVASSASKADDRRTKSSSDSLHRRVKSLLGDIDDSSKRVTVRFGDEIPSSREAAKKVILENNIEPKQALIHKVFTELSEHSNLPKFQQKATNSKINAKPKVNTNSTNSSTFPYQSIIIEKHKNCSEEEANKKTQLKYIQSQSTAPSISIKNKANVTNNTIASNKTKVNLIKCPN